MQKAKRNGALYYKCLGILHRLLNLSHFQNNLNIHNKGFKGYNKKTNKKTIKFESSQMFFLLLILKASWFGLTQEAQVSFILEANEFDFTINPSKFGFTRKRFWFYKESKWIWLLVFPAREIETRRRDFWSHPANATNAVFRKFSNDLDLIFFQQWQMY